ncbi:hypothetical protein [Actimicrobium antarcticum]|uniref:Uncharacterized protein n=1 Tax=Actimicrobium antarcticum TaxID=1051899 RepID=A0ABP7T3D3_9BURK
MSIAEQNPFQLALIHFCERRADIDVLGQKIAENVRKLTQLQQQALQVKTHLARSPGNVFELSVVRLRADMSLLTADTRRLAKLAGDLHIEFIEIAARHLAESRLRMARLVNLQAQHAEQCPVDLRQRINSAINQCHKEVEQIMGLIDRTGSSVAVLTVTTEQFCMASG